MSTVETSRIGPTGQIVIPKALRDQANLRAGDGIELIVRGGEIVIAAVRTPVRLGGRFAGSGMAGRLLEDRAGTSR
jgi:AbrB family looped-hinge helix DNA binding protein